MSDLDFLASLDAELSEITAKAKKAGQLEALRKKANNPRLAHSARSAAKSEYLAVSFEVEALLWKPETSIALFSEQSCDGCGSVHRTFLQFMEQQVHVQKPNTRKWVRVSKPQALLPRESMIQPLATHICADCCEDHGFGISPTSARLETSTSVTAAAAYLQEDLNAEG